MKTYWKQSLAIFSVLLVGAAAASVNAQDGERGPRGPREGGQRGGGQFNPEQMIQRVMQLDKDSDGKLSKEELGESRIAAMFERADTDKDGFLTKEELTAAFSRGRGQGGPGRGEGGPGGRGMGPGAGMGFQPGTIMPSFMMERLGLSEEQRKDVQALQQEVEKKLASILTEEQKEKLKEFGQQRGGFGGRGGDRPEGARGPRDGEGGPRRGPRDGEGGPRRGPRDGDNN
ncbi:EF-hand domain-containing protein [Blastopirellula marina]|nr:EF-hand domain-containing protein [Blastopirellula marina]